MTDEAPVCIATATRQASRRLAQLYDSFLAPTRLRSTQYVILTELLHAGDTAPTVTALAARLVVERSAMGQTLRPLERDGLIEIATDRDDARCHHVRLTLAGRARLEQAKPLWEQAQARLHELHGKPEMDVLRIKLHAIAGDPRLAHPAHEGGPR